MHGGKEEKEKRPAVTGGERKGEREPEERGKGQGKHGGEREGVSICGKAQHLTNTKLKEIRKNEKQIEYNTYW